MKTRDIRTSGIQSACDVCGRTLLRGERAEIYLSGGDRRSVCELCKSRALHEGWVREGTVPEYDGGDAPSDRRRSLLSRLRSRPQPGTRERTVRPPSEPATGSPGRPAPAWPDPPSRGPEPSRVREPRHVRAVPTNVEHKLASAIELFNDSEHPRTVAGVARSLGLPDVALLAIDGRPSAVGVVVSWELCWYRYEVDLSDDQPNVRLAAQGYELDELAPEERQPNAAADERGQLSLTS